MENDKLPHISVIITAYNRKEFLLSAIKSVLNQTLDKKYYEIIVIKNFKDKNIDAFINKNKIKLILMEGTIGEFLNKGTSEANGEIVSFLDDDDLFFENKLDTIYKKFKQDNNIVYYHNWCVPINSNKKTMNAKVMKSSPEFNMSSISIKKSIIKITEANKITISQGILMYLYALESNKKIIKGKETLTYYMFHNSTTNIVTNSFAEYRKFIISNSDFVLNSYILFKNFFHSRKAINFLNSLVTDTRIHKSIFETDEIPSNLINYIINSSSGLKYRTTLFLLGILIKIYPKSRKYISNRIWNIHRKRTNEII